MKLDGRQAKVMGASSAATGSSTCHGDDSGGATIWDVETRPGHLATLPGRSEPVKSVVDSEDGKFILTAGDDGKARVWDVATGVSLAVFHSDEAALVGGVFSPDEKSPSWRRRPGNPDVPLRRLHPDRRADPRRGPVGPPATGPDRPALPSGCCSEARLGLRGSLGSEPNWTAETLAGGALPVRRLIPGGLGQDSDHASGELPSEFIT